MYTCGKSNRLATAFTRLNIFKQKTPVEVVEHNDKFSININLFNQQFFVVYKASTAIDASDRSSWQNAICWSAVATPNRDKSKKEENAFSASMFSRSSFDKILSKTISINLS